MEPLASESLVVPMNVLVVTGIFPPDIGGPATYVPFISAALVNRGHKVVVVTLSDSLDRDRRRFNFRVYRIRRSLFKPLRFLLTVVRIVREGWHAHVLYANGLYLEAVFANLFLRKPLVQKIVGDWVWERARNKRWVEDDFVQFQKRRHDLKVELFKKLRNFLARRADAVIVPSEFLACAIESWGVLKSRIGVIYNMVESLPRAVSTIPLSTPFKIVTVGRLVPWKHVNHLLETVAEIQDAGLVIVGDGPDRSWLEDLAQKYHLSDRVYFAGQRNKRETLALMGACDLFVLNSSYEGFPHVVLEAMSVGLPVVATAVGGTPELVRDGENGLLIAPNSNGTLSKALIRLLNASEERQRLATGARKTTQQFRPSAMVESTEAALQWLT